MIRTANNARILEARVHSFSRGVIGLQLDTSCLASGEVGVTFDILEHNDGGIVQIIYLGDEKVAIEASAVVEGQPEITRTNFPDIASAKPWGWRKTFSGIGVGFLILLTAFTAVSDLRKGGEKSEIRDAIFRLTIAFVFFIYAVHVVRVPFASRSLTLAKLGL